MRVDPYECNSQSQDFESYWGPQGFDHGDATEIKADFQPLTWAYWKRSWDYGPTDCRPIWHTANAEFAFGYVGANQIGKSVQVYQAGFQNVGEKLCARTASPSKACPQSHVVIASGLELFFDKPMEAAAGNPTLYDMDVARLAQVDCQVVVPTWVEGLVKKAISAGVTAASAGWGAFVSLLLVFADVPNKACDANYEVLTKHSGVDGFGVEMIGYDVASWTGSAESLGTEFKVNYMNAVSEKSFEIRTHGSAWFDFQAQTQASEGMMQMGETPVLGWVESTTIHVNPALG